MTIHPLICDAVLLRLFISLPHPGTLTMKRTLACLSLNSKREKLRPSVTAAYPVLVTERIRLSHKSLLP